MYQSIGAERGRQRDGQDRVTSKVTTKYSGTHALDAAAQERRRRQYACRAMGRIKNDEA